MADTMTLRMRGSVARSLLQGWMADNREVKKAQMKTPAYRLELLELLTSVENVVHLHDKLVALRRALLERPVCLQLSIHLQCASSILGVLSRDKANANLSAPPKRNESGQGCHDGGVSNAQRPAAFPPSIATHAACSAGADAAVRANSVAIPDSCSCQKRNGRSTRKSSRPEACTSELSVQRGGNNTLM